MIEHVNLPVRFTNHKHVSNSEAQNTTRNVSLNLQSTMIIPISSAQSRSL